MTTTRTTPITPAIVDMINAIRRCGEWSQTHPNAFLSENPHLVASDRARRIVTGSKNGSVYCPGCGLTVPNIIMDGPESDLVTACCWSGVVAKSHWGRGR